MACGLHLPETATVLDARGSMVHSSKGSLLSGEERFMSGFWIIEAASTEEALALAAEGSRSCGRPVEVRQLHGPAAG